MGEGLPVAAFSWTLRVEVTGGGGGFLLIVQDFIVSREYLLYAGFQ